MSSLGRNSEPEGPALASPTDTSGLFDNQPVLVQHGEPSSAQGASQSTKSVLPITQWPGFRERTPRMGGDFRSLTRKDFHGIAPMPYRPRAVVEKCPTKVGMSHGILGWNPGHSVVKGPVGKPSLSGSPECLSLHCSLLSEQEKSGHAQPLVMSLKSLEGLVPRLATGVL